MILSLMVLIYYITKCHKIDFKRGGSYINSTDWIKKEKMDIKSNMQQYVFNMQQRFH